MGQKKVFFLHFIITFYVLYCHILFLIEKGIHIPKTFIDEYVTLAY